MRVNLIYESQGIDAEVDAIARKLFPGIYREFMMANGFEYEGQWYYSCMLSCPIPGSDKSVRYKSSIQLYSYNEAESEENEKTGNDYGYDGMRPKDITGSCGWNNVYNVQEIMKKLDPNNPYVYNDEDDYDVLFRIQICVHIRPWLDAKSSEFRSELFEVLSHELMHTKSSIREYVEAGYPMKRDGDFTVLKDTISQEIGFEPGVSGRLNLSKYMLDPNEMKSYVYSVYSYMKMLTTEGKIRGKDDLSKALASDSNWIRYKKIEDWLETVDPKDKDVESFILKMKSYKGEDRADELKHITGITTGADLIRVFKKRLKDIRQKLIKAAYKGYTDALKENGVKESMKEYYKIDARKLNEVAAEDYPEGY